MADDNSSAGATSWRDTVKFHPATELFEPLAEDELKALSDDIACNGLREGITFWTPADIAKAAKPQVGESVPDWARRKRFDLFLVDGCNRIAAIERIADPQQRAVRLTEALDCRSRCAPKVLSGTICSDPEAYVVSLNLHRRHLSRGQRRDLIEKLLRATPERSDSATAALAKVSDKTVTAVRRELEATSEFPKLERTVGKDGRARRPRKAARFASIRKSKSAARDGAIVAFSKILHARPMATLEDLAKLLQDEGRQITGLPYEKRLAIGRSYLQALGIKPDDLRSAA